MSGPIRDALDVFIGSMREFGADGGLAIGLSERAVQRLDWEARDLMLGEYTELSNHVGMIARKYKGIPVIITPEGWRQ